jgi:hypothetical protein
MQFGVTPVFYMLKLVETQKDTFQLPIWNFHLYLNKFH